MSDLQENIDDNKNLLIEANDKVIIKDAQNESVLMLCGDIEEFRLNKDKYTKLDDSMIGRLNALMHNVPLVGLEKVCAGSYRVVFDKGLGVLQKAANSPGMFRANVVKAGSNNSIVAQALLEKTSIIPNIFANAFAVMSIVTGQYYMKQINERLVNIEKEIIEIHRFLQKDKES